MKKVDVGQTINTIANLGVLVGILLLVIELSQNRQMIQAQTRNAISDTLVNILVQLASNPELVAMEVRRRAGQPLSAEDALRFEGIQTSFWRYRENVHYQYRNGLYEESEYLAQREAWIDDLNSSEMLKAMWCDRRERTSPEFVSEINALMVEPCD